METHGPPGGNCTLQSMKSNSRLFRKYFCRRKICFTFLGPLCIPISFSGAALVDMLSIQGHVHIKYILSYLLFCPMWIFINRSVQQTLSILVMVLPTLSPAVCLFLFRPEEKHLQQLSVLHLFMDKSTQMLLCVYLKASDEGNLSCSAAGAKEICGENFIWFFSCRLQKWSISWMLQLKCSNSCCT